MRVSCICRVMHNSQPEAPMNVGLIGISPNPALNGRRGEQRRTIPQQLDRLKAQMRRKGTLENALLARDSKRDKIAAAYHHSKSGGAGGLERDTQGSSYLGTYIRTCP
jgi:hypothetical protein